MANEIDGLVRKEADLAQALEGLTREFQKSAGGSGALSGTSTAEAAGFGSRGADTVVESLQAVSRSTDGLDRGLGENTRALRDASSALGSGLKGLLSGLGGGLGGSGGFSSLLKSGFGLAPLVSGIAKLFGGDKNAEPDLQAVVTPPELDLSLANSPGPVQALPRVDRGAGGAVRTAAPAQVVVNVSAMDARGFMDRSDDIAAAVRDAMLRMHAVNDVVEEL